MRFLALLALSGCATVTPLRDADGKQAFLVECQSMSRCHTAAQKQCGGAYQPIKENTAQGFFVGSTGGSGYMGPVVQYELTFRCGS
jgi:hypothetical protein